MRFFFRINSKIIHVGVPNYVDYAPGIDSTLFALLLFYQVMHLGRIKLATNV